MSDDGEPKVGGSRILVTVLYAEILGFSDLIDQQEPEIVSGLLKTLWDDIQQILTEYGGVIDKQLGDCFTVIWGTPETLEDDAERAVSASLALMESLKKFKEAAEYPPAKALQLKVGVHTGLASVGHLGVDGKVATLGNSVNIAKYLLGTGEPGAIIISDATYQSIRGAFQVKRLTPIQLVDTRQLINIFQILEELSQPTKVRYRSKGSLETILVGRDDEMVYLESIFQKTKSLNVPHLALVTGDEGIGKSRLLFEFVGHLETENPLLSVMSSRALEQTAQVPYYLWKELWSNRFELNEDDPQEVAQKKTIDGVLTIWGQTLGEVTAVEAAHFLGCLIGVDWEKSRYLDSFKSNPKARLERAFGLQAELLSRMSLRGPIVIILDDLQWTDRGSLALIQHLWKTSRRKMPLLILACARPDFITENLENFSDADVIKLPPLPISSEIVRQAYPILQDAPEKLLLSLAERAKGNPYFMEELVKNVLSSKGIENLDDQIPQLPETLEELLKSRLDSLSLEARATAYFAAVAGRVFWKDAVLAAFRGSPGVTKALSVTSHNIVGKVQKALDELMEKELAFLRVGSAFSGGREYIFKHALLREVAYQRLPEEHRKDSHFAVAEWLAGRAGPERSINVASHYEKAGVYDKAQIFYSLAANHAQSIGNDEEADDLQYHARTLPESTPHQGD